MPADLYAVLGVAPESDSRRIRAAYLDRMWDLHPDRRPGDLDAAVAAQAANAAWEVLRDPALRAAYDRRRGGPSSQAPRAASAGAASSSPAGAAPSSTRVAATPAYSADRADYSRAFLRATLRFAVVLLAVGALALFAVSSG